jgi:SHS2 domain-containing protein
MEFTGRTLKDLFLNACMGLTSVLSGEPSGTASNTGVDVKIEANDIEELLVNWLREILFLSQVRGFVTTEARFFTISPSALDASLSGRTIEDGDPPEIEIKAVTYHGLSVERGDQGYTAKVIFDI